MASNSNYYDFQNAKVVIAMELKKRGWQLFGFHEDESDMMTDYYNPAYWNGIATKNGYVAVVDCSDYAVSSYSGKRDYLYRTENGKRITMDEKDRRKIEALKEMTRERGASAAEEETAKKKIVVIENKYKEETNKYEVEMIYPVFQKNPPRASWHIEKDGTIIIKGSGIGKYSDLKYSTREKARENEKLYSDDTDSFRYREAVKHNKLWKQLDSLINKMDTAAGATIGHSNNKFEYHTEKVVKFKHENEAVAVDPYELAEGATFICKAYLGYDRNPGKVYRVHKHSDNYYFAMQLDKALKKERSGKSVRGVHFGYFNGEDFAKMLEYGSIVMCEIKDKATPYTEQKVVKKAVRTA